MRRIAAIVSGLAACAILGGATAYAGPGPHTAAKTLSGDISRRIGTGRIGTGRIGTGRSRPLPRLLYGVTVNDVTNTASIVAGLRHMPEVPTTRIYFDVTEPASYYAAAVNALRPASYLMGELLDSSDETHIAASAYNARVKSYLAALGNRIDLWEIGNEVNANWVGRYSTVQAKLAGAYNDVTAAGKRTALTLYYNIGCGDGPAELSPVAFSRAFVPPAVRYGLDYVLLSYYEDDCNGIRPALATWRAYFEQLHVLYPNALLGFGEIGMNNPATATTLSAAESLIRHYYGLALKLPYYVGGYFWWYFKQDGLPYTSKPLWGVLRDGFRAEARTRGR
jgi:hypothetical protein